MMGDSFYLKNNFYIAEICLKIVLCSYSYRRIRIFRQLLKVSEQSRSSSYTWVMPEERILGDRSCLQASLACMPKLNDRKTRVAIPFHPSQTLYSGKKCVKSLWSGKKEMGHLVSFGPEIRHYFGYPVCASKVVTKSSEGSQGSLCELSMFDKMIINRTRIKVRIKIIHSSELRDRSAREKR